MQQIKQLKFLKIYTKYNEKIIFLWGRFVYSVFLEKLPKDCWYWSQSYRKIETDDIFKAKIYYFNRLILEKTII